MKLSRRATRRIIIFMAMILVAASAAVTFRLIRSYQQQRLVLEAKRVGMSAYARGDLQTTLNQLSYHFEHKKDDLEVNLAFADARARMPMPHARHLAEAVDLYSTHGLQLLEQQKTTEQVEQKELDILSRLLDLYGQLGLRVEVMQTADRLLALNDAHVPALAAKAEVLIFERQFAEAEPVVNRLIELDPDDLSWRRLALETKIGQGVAPEALVEVCRQWANDYHGDGRFRLLTANMLIELDQDDLARQELVALTKLGAANAHVLEHSVALLDLLEMGDEAHALIEQTIQRYPKETWVREVAIRRLWHQDRLEDAFAHLDRAKSDLGQLVPPLQRLSVLVNLGDHQIEQARAELKPLLESITGGVSDSDRAWAAALESIIDSTHLKWRDQIEAIGYALAITPDDSVLHFLMGEASLQVGESSQAIVAFKNAHELDPEWMVAGTAYANALVSSGRLDEAYQVSRDVVTRSPRDRIAPLLVFARSYLALRRAGEHHRVGAGDDVLDDLISAFEQLHVEDPGNRHIVSVLADAYVQRGDGDSAGQVLRAFASHAESADDLIPLIDLSAELGLELERELLSRAEERGPATVDVVLIKARMLVEDGHLDQALGLLASAGNAEAAPAPNMWQFRAARVQLLLEADDPSAMGECRKLVADFASDIDVQRFVLSQSKTWSDKQIVAQAMANLKGLLGEGSPQVRLAEANFLLRHHAQNEALLAKAIAQINGVLQQSPHSLAALSLNAEALMIGDHPNLLGAIDSLERAATMYPADSNVLVRLISLLQRQGEFAQAGMRLEKLAQLSASQPQLKRVELRLLQAQTDFEVALVRAAALVDASSPPPDQLILASIHDQAGNRAEARAIYERLLSQQPTTPLIITQAADFFANSGEFERGLGLMQTLEPPAGGGPAAKSLAIGSFLQRFHKPDEAGIWLYKALEQDPKSIEAHLALARHELDRHDRAKAREHAMQGLQLAPDDVRLRTTLAIANLGSIGTDRQDSIELLRRMYSHDDDLVATLALLQQVPVEDGTLRPSQEHLIAAQQLVQQHGQFMPAWLLAITLHVDAERKTEAIALARQAVSRFPASAEPAQWSTELLMAAGRWNEAMVDAREWRRLARTEQLHIDAIIATIFIEMDRPSEAVQTLTPHQARLAAESAQFPERFATWVRALAHDGQFPKAVDAINPLLNDPNWRARWGAIARELDQQSARAALTLLEDFNLLPIERLDLAAHWVEIGKRSGDSACFDRAQTHASAAAASPELASKARVIEGGVAEARSDFDLAERLYRQVLDGQPDDAVALNNLANVLARSPERCAEALGFAQRALASSPTNPDFLDTYALALLGLNRVDEAEFALAKALASRPNDVVITLNLVEVLVRQERLDEAREQLAELQQRIHGIRQADPSQQERFKELLQRVESHEPVVGT